MGTQELRFNNIKNQTDSFYSSPCALDNFDHDTETTPNTNNKIPFSVSDDQAAKDGFFNMMKAFFTKDTEQQAPLTPITPDKPKDDTAMNEDQFKKFMAGQSAQTDAFNALAASLNKNESPEEEQGGDDAGSDESVTPKQFNTLSDSVTGLVEGQKTLSDQFAKLLEEKPGTQVPQGDGSHEDKEQELV